MTHVHQRMGRPADARGRDETDSARTAGGCRIRSTPGTQGIVYKSRRGAGTILDLMQGGLPLKHQGRCRLAVALCLLLSLTTVHAEDEWIYSVVDGDNLWDFSEKYLDSVKRFEAIRKINNVAQPRRMQPGTRLRVPMKWIRSNPVAARLESATGELQLIRAAGAVEASPSAGTEIRLGDRLKTGQGGNAVIQFADGSRLTLYAASEMRFDHLSAHGETGMVDSRLRLIEGRLDTQVNPAVGPGSRFEVHTPSAVSAVRGTEYRAAVQDSAGTSSVEVLRGKVNVAGGSKARLVAAGFGTQVAQGQPPIEPRELLPAPTLEALPDRIRELNWPIVWTPVQGARTYRFGISTRALPDVLLSDQLVERARMPLPDLPDGEYRLRVRAIDDIGLEGHDRVRDIVIDARPQPPVPLQPSDGKVQRGAPAELRWSASADADHYRLEIAADSEFASAPATYDPGAGVVFVTDAIDQPGTYYWRIASVAADGEVGPYSDTRSWVLKPIPDAVEPAVDASEDGRLHASWRRAGADQSYQVQLALDPGFGELEIDERVTEPAISFDPRAGQVRYLRVRTVEPDGYLGPWGAVQRIDPPIDRTRWIIPLIGVLGLLAL